MFHNCINSCTDTASLFKVDTCFDTAYHAIILNDDQLVCFRLHMPGSQLQWLLKPDKPDIVGMKARNVARPV